MHNSVASASEVTTLWRYTNVFIIIIIIIIVTANSHRHTRQDRRVVSVLKR